MNIVSAQAVPYTRTLSRPIVTSHGEYNERRGFILVIEDIEGQFGIADAAPLPGLSPDTIQECEHALIELTRIRGGYKRGKAKLLRRSLTSAEEYFPDDKFVHNHVRPLICFLEEYQSIVLELLPSSPAMLFAAATALGDLKATYRGRSLSQVMRANAASEVPINGLITGKRIEDITRQAKLLDAEGYSSFKIKVGIDHAGDDVARINAVCDAAPHARLRLDANGGWDSRWAETVLSNIPRGNVEFIEQPFPRGQWEASRLLAEKYHVRLALDEDVQTIEEARELIRNRACDVLVLKPMVLGRLYQCVLLAEEAREAGIDVIYTSSWESDIGLAATLHLAAALGPNPPAMGLSTAGMISEGIVKNPLKVENGYLKVPEGPGLGMELAPEILAQLQ